MATRNVRSIGTAGVFKQMRDVASMYGINIMALQETRWNREIAMDVGEHVMFNSGGQERRAGVGFLVKKKLMGHIMDFRAVNERISVIRLRGVFYNSMIVSVYAPTEEAEEEDKERFYAELEAVLDATPRHDNKIVMGDLNAKVGREDRYRRIVGKDSVHERCNDNGERVVDFAIRKNLRVRSKMLPRKDIYKQTWCSPDGETRNQIDHILGDSRHIRDLESVRSRRGADCGSDHFMVEVSYKQRIDIFKGQRREKAEKYNVERFRNEERVRDEYKRKIEESVNEMNEDDWQDRNIQRKWEGITEVINKANEEVLGKERGERRVEWFDEECERKVEERNRARGKLLQRNTRNNRETYKNKRREAYRCCRRKKREWERSKIEKIEEAKGRGDFRQMYKEVGEVRRGFQPRCTICKDKSGNLLGEKSSILDRWAEYFETLLNGGGEEEHQRDLGVRVEERMREEGLEEEIEAPTEGEVADIIKKLKSGKAPGLDGITAEMLKHGGGSLVKLIWKLTVEIWEREEMPEEWSMGVVCPIHKKGDRKICGNYRGITLLNLGYKVMGRVIANRLAPRMEEVVGEYQGGFRKGRSTTDQIFTLKQIIEKGYEYGVTLHNLFIDFKQAYDTVKRNALYEALEDLGIPKKLIRMVKMTMANSRNVVKIGREYSRVFNVNEGLRQGDVLSTILF